MSTDNAPLVTPEEAEAVEVLPEQSEKPRRAPAWHKLRDVEDVRKAMRQVARDALNGTRPAVEADRLMSVLAKLEGALCVAEAGNVRTLQKENCMLRSELAQNERLLLSLASKNLKGFGAEH